MDRQATVAALEAALGDVLEREVGSLSEDIRLAGDLHMDSTSMLELLMALEESFDLEIDPENLDIEDFATVGTLVSFIERTRVQQTVPR